MNSGFLVISQVPDQTKTMNRVAKWGAVAAILLLFAAAMTSCSSTRRLGCPMKITRVSPPLQMPAC
jgi:hypothetical protein